MWKFLSIFKSPRARTFLATGLIFLLLALFGWLSRDWYRDQLVGEQRADARAEVALLGNSLSSAIDRRLNLVSGLETFLTTQPDPEEFARKFNDYASGLYASTEGVSSISLAPSGVIQYVYPLEGNQQLLGFNLMENTSPEVRRDVLRAVASGQVVLSGPYELFNGSSGLIARQAAYQDGQFWGLISVVFTLDPILNRTGLGLESEDFYTAVRNQNGQMVYGEPAVFEADPVLFQVFLPDGSWETAILPVGGWQARVQNEILLFEIFGVSLLLLGTGVAYLTINNQSRLQQAVLSRTREISEINRQLQLDIAERKRVEAALRENEARTRALVDAVPDLMIRLSRDGTFLDYRSEHDEDLLMDPEEIQGTKLQNSGMPEPVVNEVLEKVAAAIDQKEMQSLEYSLDMTNGRQEYEARIVRSGLNEVVTIVRNITERKRMEAEIREREQQYRAIFESVRDGLIITDLQGRLVDFNPAAARMHGYSETEFKRSQPLDWLDPGSADVLDKYLDRIRAGRRFRSRAVHRKKDGTSFYVDVLGTDFTYRGQPHGLAVIRDVTEEVMAYQLLEERVEERTRELSTLLEVSRNVASSLDLEAVLSSVFDQLKAVVDYSALTLSVTEEDQHLVVLKYQGPLPYPVDERWEDETEAFGEGLATLREPVVIPDVHAGTPEAVLWRESAARMYGSVPADTASWMSIPLLIKNNMVGLLFFEHAQVGYYNEDRAELALAFAYQAAVAIENARLYEQAQALAAIQERQKLARELHDSVSQALYGISLGANTAMMMVETETVEKGRLRQPVEYVLTLAKAGLAEMRALIFELRPESLEQEGIVAALSKQTASLEARHRIPVETSFIEEPALTIDAKQTLYRIAQEALNNIVKHAKAGRVRVCLETPAAGEIRLVIEDNGVGFNPDGDFPGHLGLKSMHERAERLGGELNIESTPGQGTRVTADLPLKP